MCAKGYLWPYGFGISLNDPDGEMFHIYIDGR